MSRKKIIIIALSVAICAAIAVTAITLPKIIDAPVSSKNPGVSNVNTFSSNILSSISESSNQPVSSTAISQVSKTPPTSSNSSTSQTSQPQKDIAQGNIPDSIWSKIKNLPRNSSAYGPGIAAQGTQPPYALSGQNSYGKYDAYYVMPANQNIYLTFDEGYEFNNNTASILDTLKAKNVKAVFFVTYTYARDNAALIRRMIDEGHIVGNHSSAHFSYGTEPIAKCYDDFMKLHNYMMANFNYKMTLFRFPMGESNEQSLAMVSELGYKSIFWSFAHRDWITAEQPTTQQALDTITSRSHGGAIYLLHAVSNTNTAVLGDAIDSLRALKYTFVLFPA